MYKHYSRRARATSSGYYANQVADLYNFPLATGEGQTIGIIELGGGFATRDLQTYAAKLGLPGINITAIAVDGAANVPGKDPSGADGEVLLDIEIIYAIVPRANLRVYFAANTDQGFMDAVKQAIADKVDIISISWGDSERNWSLVTIQKFEQIFQQAANAGITVVAASGDSGADDDSGDGFTDHDVDYPASSQWVLAAGGTQLFSSDEEVWNNIVQGEGATGGGMSALFARPEWQTRDHIDKPNRCVPDVVGNASPLSGYNVYIDGSWQIVGGTSAVSPLYSALIARLNQILGKNMGYANPILYAINNRSYKDIVSGNNGYWSAGPNFDLASGLGRIDGATLVEDVRWAMNNAS